MSWFQQNAPPQQGSLASLGGANQGYDWTSGSPNLNGPQPVPGMPPKQFDPNAPAWTPPEWGDPSQWGHIMDNSSEGPGGFSGHAQDPNFGQLGTIHGGPYGNRGSGQPINQPMSGLPFQSMATGSLQSLGGGQLNQSGMVTLRGTDGTTKAVPQQDLAHWLSKGAVRV